MTPPAPPVTDPDVVRRTLEAVWRMEAAKVTAVVARVVGDIGLAEDLAQDAFLQALEQWPRDGLPDKRARGSPRRRVAAPSTGSGGT